MAKNNTVIAHVDSLIVLWHVLFDPADVWYKYTERLNKYQGFNDNYSKLASLLQIFPEINRQLQDIQDGKAVKCSRKVKKFYREYQTIIEMICQYSSIKDFIDYNFDWAGNLKNDSGLEYFYGYFSNHEDEAYKILAVLERLKQLGLQELQFEEDKDFTTEMYQMNTKYGIISDISFLDNMDFIPSYDDDEVVYKTTGSNYEIQECGMWGNRVIVNSLTFDPERLPNSVDRKQLFDQINSLKNDHQTECDSLRDAIDLSVAIDDLSSELDSANQIVCKLKNVNNKEELYQLLLQIKSYLDQMHAISTQYDNQVSQSSSLITEEKLQAEKQAYLKRRHSS